jgi:hypothetical protein
LLHTTSTEREGGKKDRVRERGERDKKREKEIER